MRSRQLGMSPAKIAMAVAVTMEAIAGTGSMKKVTGTSRAVAMVAVRPGTAPTNRPNAADARMTHKTYGSKTCARACARTDPVTLERPLLEQPPRERDAQQFVEGKMDRQRAHHADGGSHTPRAPEDPYPEGEQCDADDMEAELVGGEDVEDETGEHANHAQERPATQNPIRQRDPGRALAHARDDQKYAADSEPAGDHAGEPRRAEPLTRHCRKPLDVPEDRCSERDQRRAGQRVTDLYLASPTALSAAPRFLSDSSMNFAVPAGSAHTTPKPRLAMKSLYSFES